MKTTTATLDISDQIEEANELIKKQKEIGMTLLAGAFAREFAMKQPHGRYREKKLKKYRNSVRALYNQDAEKALHLASQYIKCKKMVRTATLICLLFLSIIMVTFKQVGASTQICLSLVCGMSLIVMMSAGFEGALCRYGLDNYTIRLAKSWV